MIITLLHPRATVAHLGLISAWVDASPQNMSFEEIVKTHYCGGWHPHTVGTMDTSNGHFTYPEDPVSRPFAVIMRALAGEIIYAYESALFIIVKMDRAAADKLVLTRTMDKDLPWVQVRLA